MQSAYHILVATNPEMLVAGKADLWDSGKVDSSETCHISYGGHDLISRQTCWWTVRLWNADRAQGPWAEPAFWTMGFLELRDWQADWIGYDTPLPPGVMGPIPLTLDRAQWIAVSQPTGDAPNCYGFRKVIEVENAADLQEAVAVASADRQFVLYVNGVVVGQSDGRVSAHSRPQRMDIKSHLVDGANTFGLANYAPHAAPSHGAIARIILRYADGHEVQYLSDESWRAQTDPQEGWTRAGFDDREWQPAKVIAQAGDPPFGELHPAPMEIPHCPMLRKRFEVAEKVRRATLYASALGAYELHLNGQRIGDHYFAPGWTDYHRRVLYHTYDVTELIALGDNAIGAYLGHGWYSGYLLSRVERGITYAKCPRLLAQLEIEYEDGRVEVVATDASWRAKHSPILGADLYMGEVYDARREALDTANPGQDETSWEPVVGIMAMFPVLEAYPGAPVRAMKELTPQTIVEKGPNRFILDMGQNMVGFARIRVSEAAGTRITLRFGEMLKPDGELYIENLRSARATDEYICAGTGDEVWQPRFTFHGFRYVEISGCSTMPTAEDITGVVLHADMPDTGRFTCSNELINQLQHNIEWGQRGNFLEVPTDCPQRDERLGWLGDAQVFAPTACFNMDTAAFFTKWMLDVEEAQLPDGGFTHYAPIPLDYNGCAPGWADAGVIVPWTVYEVFGDTRILSAHYGAMKKYVDHVHAHNPNRLWVNHRSDDFSDWLALAQTTPKDLVATAYLARSTRLLSRIAAVLGLKVDAERYAQLAGEVAEAFCAAFVKDDGTIGSDSQTGYALALNFNLLPDNLRDKAVQKLVNQIEAFDDHLTTGFLGCPNVTFALSGRGRLDKAYTLLEQETFPSWLYPVKNGATTVWERWDGWTDERGFQDPGMNSYNHYAYGAVGDWLYRCVAGLNPGAPGYSHVLIQPQPGGNLTFARAEFDSIRGRIVGGWKRDKNSLEIEVELPPNVRGTVHVPAGAQARILVNGRAIEKESGVIPKGSDGDSQMFEVMPGAYTFRVE